MRVERGGKSDWYRQASLLGRWWGQGYEGEFARRHRAVSVHFDRERLGERIARRTTQAESALPDVARADEAEGHDRVRACLALGARVALGGAFASDTGGAEGGGASFVVRTNHHAAMPASTAVASATVVRGCMQAVSVAGAVGASRLPPDHGFLLGATLFDRRIAVWQRLVREVFADWDEPASRPALRDVVRRLLRRS